MRKTSTTQSQSNLVAIVLLVGLTFLLGGIFVISISSIEPPSNIEDTLPDPETSPFSPDRVGGTFTGNYAEISMYDSTSGEIIDDSPNNTARIPPPPVDEAVDSKVSSLEGSPPLPTSLTGGDIRIDSGGYYVNSSNYVLSGWDNKRVIFDTSGGPIRIGVSGDGFLSGRILAEDTEFVVEGSHAVNVYVERSGYAVDINLEDVEFEMGSTDSFRVYAQSKDVGAEADVDIEGSVFRGIVYAPGSEVEVKNSEFYGASVAEKTVLDGSSYYHDESLNRLGDDALP